MQLYAFLPFNETERNIIFEYSNEETLTYKGFKVEFEDVECKCKESKYVIPCTDEFNYTIMGRENDYNYCADLSCEFEILINESCKNNEIYLKVFKNIDDPFNDTLIVKSDNYTILNTTGIYKRTYKGEMQNAIILHNRITTMKFQSSSYFNGYKSFPIGSIRLLMKAINEVTRLPKEIITADKLLYTYESEKLPENSVLTIELSKELSAYGDILKMFYETSNIQHLMTCLTFYTDDEMKIVYEFNPYSTVSIINQSITIYKHIECDSDVTKLYIKAKKTPSNKCIFQKNIINIENAIKKNNKFSMVSSSKSLCELILINDVGNYAIKGIMTKSKNNQSIKIYNSAKKDSFILELDYYSAPKWKLMTFNALSYLILIPPKTSVLFEFYDPFNVINITEPLLSYYETPYFGTPNFKPITSNTTYQISTNLEANFTVSDIHLSPFGTLQIIFSDGNVRNLTTNGDIITIALKEGQLFDIYYNEPEPGYKGAMINIEVFRK
uniref:CUB domain-containing protein n=1 Tax=Panagrolaimus sp. PS1159 TaxID=55785 RepID=A0AC35FNU6_9BILA